MEVKVYYKDHGLFEDPEEDSIEVECDEEVVYLIRNNLPLGFELVDGKVELR